MKHLVLIGSGLAHAHVLAQHARQPMAGVQVTFIPTSPATWLNELLPEWVAGRVPLHTLCVDLAAWLQTPGLNLLTQGVVALDAQQRQLKLHDGSVLKWDALSIDTPLAQDRRMVEDSLPGAREHALFLHPAQAFTTLWPQVQAMAGQRPLHVAVLGGGPSGAALASAVAHTLAGSHVTLLADTAPVEVPPSWQALLKAQGVTTLPVHAVGLAPQTVRLSNGAQLGCDVPVLAGALSMPTWLVASGLAQDSGGRMAVDACLRSTSHPQVWVSDALSSRVQQALGPERSAWDELRLGYATHLEASLRSSLAGVEPTPPTLKPPRLRTQDLGMGRAQVAWGRVTWAGPWVYEWVMARIRQALPMA
jgi:NADH dehydrogenase FAD-containing subunit